MDHEFYAPPEPSSRLDAAPLYVSLFLVLLVFFIVLNAVSIPTNAKRREVFQGVAEQFSPERTSMPARSKAEQIAGDQLVGQMREIAKSYLELTEINLVVDGDTAVLRVPVSSLFGKDGNLREPRLALLDALAKGIRGWEDEWRLDVACILHVPAESMTAPDALAAEATRKAGILVRALQQRGVPEHALSATLAAGDPKQASFAFRLRPNAAKWPTPLVAVQL